MGDDAATAPDAPDAFAQPAEPAPSAEGGPSRCPCCHDEAIPHKSLVCVECLARHHPTCWHEAGRCGRCSCTQHLEPPPPPPLTRERAVEVLDRAGHTSEQIEELFARTEEAGKPKPSRFNDLTATAIALSVALAVVFQLLPIDMTRPSVVVAAIVGLFFGWRRKSYVWALGAAVAFSWIAMLPLGVEELVLAAIGAASAIPGLALVWWTKRLSFK